jgi:tripartite-type tricarboxylate transporter receptor subunit TctC
MKSFLSFILVCNICFAAELPKDINIITYSGSAGSTGNKNQMLIALKSSMMRYSIEPKLIYRAGAEGILAMNLLAESKTDGSFLGIFSDYDISTLENAGVRKFDKNTFTKLFDISEYSFVLTASFKFQMKKDLLIGNNGLRKKELIELYTKKLGLNYTLIQYPSTRGETIIMMDVSEERVDLFFAAITGAVPLYKANKLKLLGVTSPHRLPGLEEIPSISETIPNFKFTGENSIYIHQEVSEEIKNEYRKLFKQIEKDPIFRKEIISKWNIPTLKVYSK